MKREDAVVLADGYIQQVHEKFDHMIKGPDAVALAMVDVCEDLLRFKDSMNTLLEELTAIHGQNPPETHGGSPHGDEGFSEGEGPGDPVSPHTHDPVQEHTFDPTLEGEITCPNCDSLMDARGFNEEGEFTFYSCPEPSCLYTEDR